LTQTLTATVQLVNKRGLHARASNKFMECVMQFTSQVLVRSHNDVCAETVIADSVMELLLLGAACGEEITISATGEDATDAIKALITLVESRFGEDE